MYHAPENLTCEGYLGQDQKVNVGDVLNVAFEGIGTYSVQITEIAMDYTGLRRFKAVQFVQRPVAIEERAA